MRRLLIGVLVGLAAGSIGGTEASVPKPLPPAQAHAATARLIVRPGQTVRWRSPRIGRVDTWTLTIAGRENPFAEFEPRTGRCVVYGYQAGVALRYTDCRQGRPVPYVRVRAVSAALKPITVTLELN